MKKFLDNFLLHSYIDILAGLVTLLGLHFFGIKGIVGTAFLVLHVFVSKTPDEREQMLISKAYAYAFNFLIGSMGLFAVYCPNMITPLFVFGLGILLRGIAGVVVFTIY